MKNPNLSSQEPRVTASAVKRRAIWQLHVLRAVIANLRLVGHMLV